VGRYESHPLMVEVTLVVRASTKELSFKNLGLALTPTASLTLPWFVPIPVWPVACAMKAVVAVVEVVAAAAAAGGGVAKSRFSSSSAVSWAKPEATGGDVEVSSSQLPSRLEWPPERLIWSSSNYYTEKKKLGWRSKERELQWREKKKKKKSNE